MLRPVLSSQKKLDLLACLALAFIAVVFFQYLFGLEVLNPHNFSWLMKGDPAQHFFGLNFFLAEPWNFQNLQLGKINTYSAPIGTSLVYTDSIPLLAFLSKFFGAAPRFQYFGFWILLSFLSMPLVSYWVCGRFTQSKLQRFLIAFTLMTFPVFLMRSIQSTRHYTLLGQWILVFLFPLVHDAVSKAKARDLAWGALFLLTIGIHFYFFCMLFFVWLFMQPLFRPTRDRILFYFVVFTAVLFLMWVYGYFVVPAQFAGRPVLFTMNVLAWFNPDVFSFLFPPITIQSRQYEGFQFLGSGVLTAVLMAFAFRKSRKQILDFLVSSKNRSIIAVTLFLFFLSISNPISIGPLSIPEPLSYLISFGVLSFFFWPIFSKKWAAFVGAAMMVLTIWKLSPILASTGRMFWPVSLAIPFLLLTLQPNRIITIVLFCVQIIDTYPLIQKMKFENKALVSTDISHLFTNTNPFSKFTGAQSVFLIDVPKKHHSELSHYALELGLSIGPNYTARRNKEMERELDLLERQNLISGNIQENVIYIVGDAKLDISSSLAKENLLGLRVCFKE